MPHGAGLDESRVRGYSRSMTTGHHGWSLRWLLGGVYFGIMTAILGGLALYFSYRVEEGLVSRSLTVLRGSARIGADTLTPDVQTLAQSTEPARRNDAVKGIERTLRGLHLRTFARRVALLTKDGKVVTLRLTQLSRRGRVLGYGAPRAAETPFTSTAQPSSRFDPEVRDAIHFNDLGENIRPNPSADGEITFYMAVPVQIRERVPIPTDVFMPTKPTIRHHLVTRYILLLAVPLTEIYETISSMKTAIGLAFLAALLVMLAVNTFVSNAISQPLANLSEAAQRVASGNLDERVQPSGITELASLADSFNLMADQLQTFISTLASERAQAEAMLASMADAVLVTNTDGQILLLNNAAEILLGLQADTTVGKTLTEAQLHFEMDVLLQKTLASETSLRHDVVLTRPTERFVEVHMAPVKVDGQTIGVVIVLYDMTNERRLAQIRRDFVANVSHELRTPVTSIRAIAETLLDGGLEEPEMARDFLATVTAESERLTALLDDLLHLSQIESGRRHLALETLDLARLVNDVAQRLITPITAKGQRLVLDIPAPMPTPADRDALIQVLINLMDNARKYSPEGATITVRAIQDQRFTYLRVSDTGFGIPHEEQERIFERFYRVDKARSRAQGGTGLGLSIVKHLVELHGGWIAVESAPGVGSVFTVTLPRHTGVASPEDAGERASGFSQSDDRQMPARE